MKAMVSKLPTGYSVGINVGGIILLKVNPFWNFTFFRQHSGESRIILQKKFMKTNIILLFFCLGMTKQSYCQKGYNKVIMLASDTSQLKPYKRATYSFTMYGYVVDTTIEAGCAPYQIQHGVKVIVGQSFEVYRKYYDVNCHEIHYYIWDCKPIQWPDSLKDNDW
jgi:hypothetical protein